MTDPLHVCTEIRGEKVLIWCAKHPDVRPNVMHPDYANHRAYSVAARGGGGRLVLARVEKPARILDRALLRAVSSGAGGAVSVNTPSSALRGDPSDRHHAGDERTSRSD